jgi:hypothetical protein
MILLQPKDDCPVRLGAVSRSPQQVLPNAASSSMASTREGESSSRTLTVLACGLPLLGLLTLLPVARGRRLLICLGFVLFVSATGLTGCGGGSSDGNKTAPGNYTFNVVATSSSTSSTASYKLTVQ